jgi:hypothetical protein
MRYALLIILSASLAGCSEKEAIASADEYPQASGEPQAIATPSPTPKPRDRVVAEASKLMGLKETHGRNRSPIIDKMNLLANANYGDPWCASFNAYVYRLADIPKYPVSAWSPAWVANPTWTRAKGGETPKPGDPFGIYFSNKGRVAHTGLIKSWGDAVQTYEGNTGPTGVVGEADRNGDGSYVKRRLKSQIYSVRNWID